MTDDQTARERYDAKIADALCQGCHAAVNPLGFVLERYDVIDRNRDQEIVIDQVSGDMLATLPIDSSATLPLPTGEVTMATGRELSQQVVASGQLELAHSRVTERKLGVELTHARDRGIVLPIGRPAGRHIDL